MIVIAAAVLIPVGFIWPKLDAVLVVMIAVLAVAYVHSSGSARAPTSAAEIMPFHTSQGQLPQILHP